MTPCSLIPRGQALPRGGPLKKQLLLAQIVGFRIPASPKRAERGEGGSNLPV